MPQLPLPITLPESFSADNFLVSDCNREAYSKLTGWPGWEGHALYLCGKKGSGKSHLANIWAKRANAVIIPPDAINPASISGNCAVEDIEQCRDETSLLHLFNHCRDIGVYLLLTSTCIPSLLPFTLPDLTSRLRACPLALIQEPDDMVLSGAMRKQFSDRQLLVDDEVISYLTSRMERTLSSVKTLVETLDKISLAEQKTITIPFVRKTLGY
jgi:DnaA regulatory inactivator Hda